MCDPLNGEIIGKSQLKDGTTILITRNIDVPEVNVIGFDKTGHSQMLGIFEDFEKMVVEELTGLPYVKTLAF